jgi:hypothetical protein
MLEPNERNIEKLLRASGARRLEQAGDPEMHPAMRETLHTEVQRQLHPAPQRSRSRARLILGLLPKLAVFVALGMCAWLLFFRDADSKKGPGPLAMGQAANERADLKEEQIQPLTMVPAEAGMTRQNEPLEKAKVSESLERQIPESAPVTVERRMATAAPAMETPAGRDSSSVAGADYFKADRDGMFLGTAMAEADRTVTSNVDEGIAMATLMDTQLLKASGAPAITSQPGRIAPQNFVLQNFTVVNEGNTVRFVDGDGSTYTGEIQPLEETPVQSSLDQATENSPTGSPASTSATPAPAYGKSQLLNFNVVASGTNRSLGQSVRFTGNLTLTDQQLNQGRNQFQNTIAPIDARLPAQRPALGGQSTLGVLRGTALIDGSKLVPVNAVPTPP